MQASKQHPFIQKLHFHLSENSENLLLISVGAGAGGGRHSTAICWKIVVIHLHVQCICAVRSTTPFAGSAQPALLYPALPSHEVDCVLRNGLWAA